jgi:hypothetical protein
MKKLFTAFLLFFVFQVNAQDLKASVNDLAFMSGTWTLKHEWGDMEEFWGPPLGNSLISSYRCVKDGKVVFYEFVVIEEIAQNLVLKLRHFNPGSIGWEDKNAPLEYPLVEFSKNKAVFEAADKSNRLIYRLVSGNLEVVLEEKNKEDKMERTVFAYKRKI